MIRDDNKLSNTCISSSRGWLENTDHDSAPSLRPLSCNVNIILLLHIVLLSHSCNNAMSHVTLPLTPTAMAWCLGEPRPCCTAICHQTVRGTHWLFVEKSETWELISGNDITWVVTLWVTLSGCRPAYYITSSTNDTQWRIFEYLDTQSVASAFSESH